MLQAVPGGALRAAAMGEQGCRTALRRLQVQFGGVRARITFYLKRDRVEAFDVRSTPRTPDAWRPSSRIATASLPVREPGKLDAARRRALQSANGEGRTARRFTG